MLFKPKSGLFFSPDDGSGGGGGTPQPANGENKQQPQSPQSPPPTPQAWAAPIEFGGRTFKSAEELQAFFDSTVESRLSREKEHSKKQADEASRKAAEKALADNAEWQKLAETRQKSLDELTAQHETAKQKAERYEKALGAQLEAAKVGLPAPVLALLERLDVAEQLEWIAENRQALTPAANGANGAKSAPVPQTPPSTPGSNPDVEAKNEWLRSVRRMKP